MRGCDCVARVGGDECAVLTWGLDRTSAAALGNRTVAAVEGAASALDVARWGVGAAVGAALAAGDAGPAAVLEAADAALLKAKAEGKGRAALATGLPEPPPAQQRQPTRRPSRAFARPAPGGWAFLSPLWR